MHISRRQESQYSHDWFDGKNLDNIILRDKCLKITVRFCLQLDKKTRIGVAKFKQLNSFSINGTYRFVNIFLISRDDNIYVLIVILSYLVLLFY